MQRIHKYPRLFTPQSLKNAQDVELPEPNAHYLKNVLRLTEGNTIRVFNGKDGEWLANVTKLTKKTAHIRPVEPIKTQPASPAPLQLLFAPIKKNRLDFLIEKAVELGVTDLHPVLTAHTKNRKINEERLSAQMIEALEQCERLDTPVLHPLSNLRDKLHAWPQTTPVLWAAERMETTPELSALSGKNCFLIGPEGGFDHDEIEFLLKTPFVKPVSLGSNILRSETAALFCLSLAQSEC